MKTRVPADDRERRQSGLLLLLGVVVAGFSWQIAARTGLAEPAAARTARPSAAALRTPAATERSVPAKRSAAPVDYASRLGLARPGTAGRHQPSVWMQKPVKPSPRKPIATASAPAHRESSTEVSQPGPSVPQQNAAVAPRVVQEPAMRGVAGGSDAGRATVPSTRAGWSQPALHARPVSDEDEDEDLEADDEELDDDLVETGPVPHPEAEREPGAGPAHGAQMLVLGPAVLSKGDVATFTISVEDATDVAHAPIRLVYDPEVLELVNVEEGAFFSSDGTATRFLARTGSTPGILDISLSRVRPQRGIDGGGVLCTVSFLARSAGSSPVVLAGSRLLDPDGGKLEFTRSDADVAVKP